MKFVSKSYVHYADTTVPDHHMAFWFFLLFDNFVELFHASYQALNASLIYFQPFLVQSTFSMFGTWPTLFDIYDGYIKHNTRDRSLLHSSAQIHLKWQDFLPVINESRFQSYVYATQLCPTIIWLTAFAPYLVNFAEPFHKCYQRRMCHWSTSCPFWYTKHIFHVWYVRERRYLIYTMGI